MLGFRDGLLPAAILATALSFPVAAQPPGGAPTGPPDAAPWNQSRGGPQSPSGVNMSDATVGKVGAALRQVAEIKQTYSERLQSAKSPAQQEDISKKASGAAVTAITQQGLTLDQYNKVIEAAQKDPALKQRVLAAAGASQ
jgi:hypothetical protein